MLLFLASACGDPPPVKTALSLAPTYDAVGVARVFADGIAPRYFREFYLTFDALQVAGGRAIGSVAQKGTSVTPHAVMGTFDGETGQLELNPISAALTSSSAENVRELGGLAQDILPKDGVADEISGFIDTQTGRSFLEGIFLATARTSRRPAEVDDARVHVTRSALGKISVLGDAGAAVPSVGIEVFRFEINVREPGFTLGQARDDGSFAITIDGLEEDVFLLRARAAGVASDARFFRVQ